MLPAAELADPGRGMKRAMSPEGMRQNGSITENGMSKSHPDGAGHRSKRERFRRKLTLCRVCNIQLNSPAQAQIHYNGKSHQRRLKQIGNDVSGGSTPSHTGPLLASFSMPGRPLQAQLDLKHLLPFHLNASSPLSLFPNFNTMDPVQKAVISHTFGVPQPLKKKPVISCNICHLRFNSLNQAEAHYKGHKHARKLKAIEAQKSRQQRRLGDHDQEHQCDTSGKTTEETAAVMPKHKDGDMYSEKELRSLQEASKCSDAVTTTTAASSLEKSLITSPHMLSSASDVSSAGASDLAGDGELSSESDKDPKCNKEHLHCTICKVTVNSTSQLEAHNSGTKHKLMMEGQSVQPRRRSKALTSRTASRSKRLGVKSSVSVAQKTFSCEICEIHVNSETQLKQHMNSRRHKDRLAGKPLKAKHNIHSKSQQNSASMNVRWSSYAGGAISAMKKVFSSFNSLSSQTKVALHKQLTKSLSPGFLSGPLNPAAICTMSPGPLTLRPTASFIQTPLLGPTFLRPAPGPLRATHGQIIFSPY